MIKYNENEIIKICEESDSMAKAASKLNIQTVNLIIQMVIVEIICSIILEFYVLIVIHKLIHIDLKILKIKNFAIASPQQGGRSWLDSGQRYKAIIV